MLTVLDRLGEPGAIIAAEAPDPDMPPTVLGTVGFALLVLAPIACSIYLARRAA